MDNKMKAFKMLIDIKKQIPNFEREELLEYTKMVIPVLYEEIKAADDKENITIKCNEEIIDKLIKNKDIYRINNKMDRVNVQYAELYDYMKKEKEIYLIVYASVYFYDDVDNNMNNVLGRDRHWNEIWIITYRDKQLSENREGNCKNCGAPMQYDELKKVFKCDYCGNVVKAKKWVRDWEIVDIEVKK